MQIARRVYLYAMATVTLGVAAYGLFLLVRVAIHALHLVPAPEFAPDVRSDVSLALAMLAVGMPVFGVHWWLILRALRPTSPTAASERASAVRATYLAVVLALALGSVAAGAVDLIRWAIVSTAVRPSDLGIGADVGSSSAMFLVGALVWLAHAALLSRDRAAVPLVGAAAWIPRLYVYGAAFVGLAGAIGSVGSLASAALTLPPPELANDPYRAVWIAGSIGGMVVGSVVWAIHWRWSSRASDARGDRERDARMRLAYFVVAIGVGVGLGIASLAGAAAPAISRAIDAPNFLPDATDPIAIVRLAVGPLVSGALWIAVWFAHARWLRREANERGDPGRIQAERLIWHDVSAVALAAGGVALGWLAGLAVDLALGGTRTTLSTDWKGEMATWLPQAVLGIAVWGWSWRRVVRRARRAPEAEASSTIRRAHLLLAVALATIASVAGATVIVYRLVSSSLGVGSERNLVSDLSTPIGALLVGIAIAAYHAIALRADDRIRAVEARHLSAVVATQPGSGPRVEPSAARAATVGTPGAIGAAGAGVAVDTSATSETVPASPAAEPTSVSPRPGASRTLVLSGAEDEDLEPVVEALRAALPSGHTLELR